MRLYESSAQPAARTVCKLVRLAVTMIQGRHKGMRKLTLELLAALFLAQLLPAHQQPTTLVMLNVGSDGVAMKLHIPLTELELAFGHDVTQRPEERTAVWGPAFRRYLIEHIHPVTPAGQPWSVQVLDLSVASAEQVQSGPFQEVTIELSLAPPAGASVRDFILNYDVILHQVVTHRALVSVHSDWAAGRMETTQVETIAVNTGTSHIEPLTIHLAEGSWWAGFRGMLRLGIHHIRNGTDHLLFLLVLLLPATLTVRSGKWCDFGGSYYSLARLVRIVTAFTLGHSATLLAGALHWLKLPQQPVEVLIACSVLVTAIHSIRPIFPGRGRKSQRGSGWYTGSRLLPYLRI
jgi:hypothetical protein